MRRHTFILGASGSGKTNLINLLMQHDLKTGTPLVYIDPKGERKELNTFIKLCKKYDREAYIFAPTYTDASQYNPIKGMDTGIICETIMRNFDWGNDYYEATADLGIINSVEKLKELNEIVDLPNILKVLESHKGNDLKEVMGIIAKLKKIIVSRYGRLFKDDGTAINMNDIRNRNACLYISVPTQGYFRLAKTIAKIMINELMYHSFQIADREDGEEYAKEHPISLYIDEAGSILHEDFIDLLNKCRTSGIQVTAATQSLADFDKINPCFTKQVSENSSNLIVMKQSVDEDVNKLCKQIGTINTEKRTMQEVDGEDSGNASVRETHEYIAHAEIIKSLRLGQGVVLTHQPKTVNFLQFRYLDHLKLELEEPFQTSIQKKQHEFAPGISAHKQGEQSYEPRS